MAIIRLISLWFRHERTSQITPAMVRRLHRLLLWQMALTLGSLILAAIALYMGTRELSLNFGGLAIGWFAVIRYHVWLYVG